LMLKLIRISGVNRNDRTINMQLSNKGAISSKFRPECISRTFPEPEQAYQNILLGIFIRNKRLPSLTGHIIPPDQLNILWLELVMNLLDTDLPCPDIPARDIHFFHLGQCQLS